MCCQVLDVPADAAKGESVGEGKPRIIRVHVEPSCHTFALWVLKR